MQKVFNVAVDIGRKLPAPAFEVNTNDLKSVKLLITITNGQTLLNLTDTTVRIAIRKPDSHIIFQDCTVKDAANGQVEIILENQAYIMPGTHTAEIMCYKGSEVVAVSGTFSYKSTKGIMNDEAVESKSEFTTISNMMKDVQETIDDIRKNGTGIDAQARQDIEEVATQLAEKAEKEEVRLKTQKISQIDVTEEFLQQMAGDTPINAVPVNFGVTKEKLAINAVDVEQTTFLKRSKNLFNKATALPNKFVNPSTGNIGDNTTYYASDFISIIPVTNYVASPALAQIAFYDINKVYISGLSWPANNVVTTPENAFYCRVSAQTAKVSEFQFEVGTTPTPYESFRVYLDKVTEVDGKVLKPASVSKIALGEGVVDATKTDFLKVSKNLFNPKNLVVGYFVNSSSGNLIANTAYSVSDHIALKPNITYTVSFGHQIAFYDSEKKFISGVNGGNAKPYTFKTPTNVYFARFTFQINQENSFQLSEGSVLPPYEAFGYSMENIIINDELQLFLPPEICVAVGRTIELYNKQVAWCGNINNFHFKWDCQVGKSLKRKFSVMGETSKIGEYPLTLTVYDNNMRMVASASSTIKIFAAIINSEVKLLEIGDSLSNNKPWYSELKTLSNNMIKYVGTRTGGVPAGEGYEGRSGATAGWYLANSTYTFDSNYDKSNPGTDGKENPFWNPTTNAFDYAYYKTTYNKNPNAIQIFLGTNGMTLDPTANANNIKTIVDGIRNNDASIPIFVVFTLYRGNQDGLGSQTGTDGYAANKGAWKLEEDRKVFNLMVTLYDLLKDYTNLHFVPISLCHDSEYNFGAVSTPVNPRASQTELLPTEATHPQTQGYLQMADIMFSVIAKYLK